MPRLAFMCALAIAGLILPLHASATTVTFDADASLVHGRVVDSDFAGQGITSITTTNIGGGPSLGVIYDSDFGGPTTDPDPLNPWAGRNIAGATDNGNLLIIQENSTGCGDDICNDPDDEGSRPAGSFDILFALPQASFGFDLLDVEDTTNENGSIVFYDGLSTFSISWSDFEAGSGSAFEVAGMVFGNNFGNRIPEITAGDVGLTKFDRVVINMGGSGAIDNLVFTPEPGTVLLIVGGLALLAARTRRD